MAPRSRRADTLALDRAQSRPVGFEDAGRKNFLYYPFKAGPAGGLRPPSAGSTADRGIFGLSKLQHLSEGAVVHRRS